MREAFYNYAIDGLKTNENNAAIIDIYYGDGKSPLHIFKKDMRRFIKAIISLEEMQERDMDLLKGEELEKLNYLLKGRGIIIITGFKTYFEYANGIQNGIKEIAALRINGTIDRVNSFDYETLKPRNEEVFC